MGEFPTNLFTITLIGFALLASRCERQEAKTPFYNQDIGINSLTQKELKQGEALFFQQCARCHGMNAEGGTGPSLKRPSFVNTTNNFDLVQVIQNGIPGTEMPANWMLSNEDAIKVAGYIKSFNVQSSHQVYGDVEKGKLIFNTKGACITCHVVKGDGRSIGPDLSHIGSLRGIQYLKSTLLDPGSLKKEGLTPTTASGFLDYLIFEIETRDGFELTAMRLNEDAFSIQLKDIQNQLYSFQKRDLVKLDKKYGISFMPSVRLLLDDSEINDLLTYLLSLK